MPELPEVETTLRGIYPHLINQKINKINVNHYQLRYPINPDFIKRCQKRTIKQIYRRAKYLIIELDDGNILLHLGMSGHLRISEGKEGEKKHDHVEFILENKKRLRFNDPRRFGLVQWFPTQTSSHPLLEKLGPEPLTDEFNGDYLWLKSRNRKVAVKHFIMNNNCVVGVGNIYACESLFLSRISPKTPANKISKNRYKELAKIIKNVLVDAINQGGTTLKDFLQSDGKPGYFTQSLTVYGKSGEPCIECNNLIKSTIIGQRTTYFCSHCQKP